MQLFVILAGLLWVGMGIFGLVATKKAILALSNLVKNTRRQSLGLFSLIFGVLLVISASSVREAWFVLALGVMACLKGVSLVLMPEKKLTVIMDWWLAAPEIVHKCWAAFILILGIVMFYII